MLPPQLRTCPPPQTARRGRARTLVIALAILIVALVGLILFRLFAFRGDSERSSLSAVDQAAEHSPPSRIPSSAQDSGSLPHRGSRWSISPGSTNDPAQGSAIQLTVRKQDTSIPIDQARIFIKPANPSQRSLAALRQWQLHIGEQAYRGGLLELPVPSSVPWIVCADVPHSTTIGSKEVLLEPLSPGETRQVLMELPWREDPAEFSGQLVDAATGFGLPGHVVYIDKPGSICRLPTSQDGTFNITLPFSGSLNVSLQTDGYLHMKARIPGYDCPPLSPCRLALDAPAKAIGRVSSSWGSPLAGAKILFRANKSDMVVEGFGPCTGGMPVCCEWGTTCNTSGEFELDILPSRIPLGIEVEWNGAAVVPDEALASFLPGVTERIAVVVDVGSGISGSVFNAAGSRLAGVELQLFSSVSSKNAGEPHPYASTMTSESGEYSFAGVDPGHWEIRVPAQPALDAASRAELAGTISTWVTIEPRGGAITHDIHLPDTSRVSGKVSPSSDEPVLVELRPLQGGHAIALTADETGCFAVSCFNGNPWVAFAFTKSGLVSSPIRFSPPAQLELQLVETARLKAFMVSGDGRPTSGQVWATSRSTEAGFGPFDSDQEGYATIALPPDVYAFYAISDSREVGAVSSRTLDPGVTTQSLLLECSIGNPRTLSALACSQPVVAKLLHGGVLYRRIILRPGATENTVLPIGLTSIVVCGGGGLASERTLHVPGELDNDQDVEICLE